MNITGSVKKKERKLGALYGVAATENVQIGGESASAAMR